MIRIIVIEREYGCGGSVIAEKLAQRLGWRLFDRQLTEEIARLAEVSAAAVERHEERIDPLFYRLSRVFWRGSYERSLPVSGLETFDCDRTMALMQRVVENAAATGQCIIVGRGAPYFLRERTDTLVRVPVRPRVSSELQRVLAHTNNEKEANELVDSVDRDGGAFIKHYFDKEWPHRPLYHVMLNTALGEETAGATILSWGGAQPESDSFMKNRTFLLVRPVRRAGRRLLRWPERPATEDRAPANWSEAQLGGATNAAVQVIQWWKTFNDPEVEFAHRPGGESELRSAHRRSATAAGAGVAGRRDLEFRPDD